MDTVEKLAISLNELAKVMGIGLNRARDMVNTPGFPVIRFGKRILIPVEPLKAWMAKQSESKGE